MIRPEDKHLVAEAEDIARRIDLTATGANIHKFKTKSSFLMGCISIMKKADGDTYNYWRNKLVEALSSARELVYPDP